MTATLSEQYKMQWRWRDWEVLFGLLPSLEGKTVYDIGCAIGDHSECLAERGARVIGLDGNAELLEVARAREIKNARFEQVDLSNFDFAAADTADGVWTSFVAAYFTDLDKFIQNLSTLIKPGGFLAITEMDDLFGHGPGLEKYREKIEEFYRSGFDRKAYDFRSGSKLKASIENAGLEIVKETELSDRELAFLGAAEEEILQAWSQRLDRMPGFQKFLGEDFDDFHRDFLACLANPNHESQCRSLFYLARVPK